MSQQTFPNELMEQFKAVKRPDGEWAIQLEPGRYLHWIESTDNKPVTGSRPDIVMQSWPFREMAEHMIGWLKILWNKDPAVRATLSAYPLTVNCEIPDEVKVE